MAERVLIMRGFELAVLIKNIRNSLRGNIVSYLIWFKNNVFIEGNFFLIDNDKKIDKNKYSLIFIK